MNWRFRKIFKVGPVKATFSKRGVGMSWGIPGFRVGISAKGGKYITIGIPGTGIYFIKYFTPDMISNQGEHPLIKDDEKKIISKKNEEPWWKQKNL